MNNIFIATTTFAQFSSKPLEILDSTRYKIFCNDKGRKLESWEINDQNIKPIGIIAGTEIYSQEILEKLPHLKVISRLGIGIDNIALDFVKKKGIKVFKTKTTPGPAVAELVLGLMINVARKISIQNNYFKSGIWKKEMGDLLQGKTLGIIGLGGIGKNLIQLSSGFGFKILAFDQNEDILFANENDVTYCDLEFLLENSDIISIHLNLTDETNQLMNEKQIGKMKNNSILINTSRGEIIDEKALYRALKDEKILGAGLDVFKDEPYSGPLKELNNVILTPHIGSYAKEIRIQMEIEAVKNLIRGLNEAK